ncbi:hypothetical protein C2G38_858960 [Gigaspora rosea]|uniref:Uncharacterized protein n=1 Tax=Gigaspora rosea TaxID=44941 RepID=A0A397U0T2_9GLOM|nr:hypothetical protein C2G38_858960 [Gigaspora rosea]
MATSDPSSSDLNGSKDVASSSSIHSIQNLIADQFKAKDEKIEKLQKELDYYKKQYESLQNNMSPDQPINNRNYDPKKVTELKVAINKVVDDVLLSQEHTNRPLVFSNYNRGWGASGSTPTTTHTTHTIHTTHTEANKLIDTIR